MKSVNEDGKNYDDLETMYGELLGQYNRYMGHVTSNIGGVYEYYKTYDQEGAVYTHVDKAKQKDALSFLLEWMEKNNQESIVSKTQIIIAPGYQFKIVNDLCGHTAGDLLLKNLSQRLYKKLKSLDEKHIISRQNNNSDEHHVNQIIDESPSAEDIIITKQNLAQLLRDIKKLKPHYQDVINLRYFVTKVML